MEKIITKRLDLLSQTEEMILSILKGNKHLSSDLKIAIPHDWPDFGLDPKRWNLEQLRKDPGNQHWLGYLPILRQENLLVGSCGFKGKPDNEGIVEIGYAVNETHRGRGLATEIAAGLTQHAFNDPRVKKVIAHTLPETNASGRVLTKCGFKCTGSIIDPEDGLIWRWELPRN